MTTALATTAIASAPNPRRIATARAFTMGGRVVVDLLDASGDMRETYILDGGPIEPLADEALTEFGYVRTSGWYPHRGASVAPITRAR